MSGRDADADIAIVGGGAAGLMAAIAAGRHAGRVVLLDGAPRLGAKLLISGGGRCNVTNARVSPRDFNGGSRRVVERVLKALPAERTVALLAGLGVSLHEEARGKLFPDTGRARTVLDALVGEARRVGVAIHVGQRVTRVSRAAAGFEIETPVRSWSARRVVLATGGLSVPKTGSDGHGLHIARSLGHAVVATTPALVPLLLGGGFHAGLAGVTADVSMEVVAGRRVSARVEGPLLWTHVGVSGPAALDASRHWHRAALEGHAVEVRLNLAGGRAFEEVDAALAAGGRSSVRAAVEAWMPGSVATAVVSRCGVEPGTALAHLPRDERRAVAHAVTALPLDVTGSRGYTHAEATAGGVSLDGIDPATMESRMCAGLYLAGEMLDVDGRLGGFNFQWAWSSGWVAGRAAARASGGGA